MSVVDASKQLRRVPLYERLIRIWLIRLSFVQGFLIDHMQQIGLLGRRGEGVNDLLLGITKVLESK